MAMTTRDIDMLEGQQSAERWLAADLVIGGLGCALLALCALAAWALYRMVHRSPTLPATIGELAVGAAAVVTWACGWALVGEGKGLFRRVAVPDRHPRFTLTRSKA
jgi:hypothetical protein